MKGGRTPGIDQRGAGKEVVVLDPASNQVRFFEAGTVEASG
jgi:hypothetical protein